MIRIKLNKNKCTKRKKMFHKNNSVRIYRPNGNSISFAFRGLEYSFPQTDPKSCKHYGSIAMGRLHPVSPCSVLT